MRVTDKWFLQYPDSNFFNDGLKIQSIKIVLRLHFVYKWTFSFPLSLSYCLSLSLFFFVGILRFFMLIAVPSFFFPTTTSLPYRRCIIFRNDEFLLSVNFFPSECLFSFILSYGLIFLQLAFTFGGPLRLLFWTADSPPFFSFLISCFFLSFFEYLQYRFKRKSLIEYHFLIRNIPNISIKQILKCVANLTSFIHIRFAAHSPH